jgi:FK506-binding protein 15
MSAAKKVEQAMAEVAKKEQAAMEALRQAEQLKKEAQELLLTSHVPSTAAAASSVGPSVTDLFKEVVNDVFFRFQDVFEGEVALDGNEVLKEIKKILKQSTKEMLQKVQT